VPGRFGQILLLPNETDNAKHLETSGYKLARDFVTFWYTVADDVWYSVDVKALRCICRFDARGFVCRASARDQRLTDVHGEHEFTQKLFG